MFESNGIKSLLAASLTLAIAGPSVAAVKTWDAGGDGVTWGDANNWNDDTLPTNVDLVFINGAATSSVTLNSNQIADAVRFADGANLNHTGGTLTVTADGPDTESSFPEFGPRHRHLYDVR